MIVDLLMIRRVANGYELIVNPILHSSEYPRIESVFVFNTTEALAFKVQTLFDNIEVPA